jgi:hypothetical protein
MMKTSEAVKVENMELLMEIVSLRAKLSKLYNQSGPNTSEYITLSIQLDLLMKEYFEEKTAQLITV